MKKSGSDDEVIVTKDESTKDTFNYHILIKFIEQPSNIKSLVLFKTFVCIPPQSSLSNKILKTFPKMTLLKRQQQQQQQQSNPSPIQNPTAQTPSPQWQSSSNSCMYLLLHHPSALISHILHHLHNPTNTEKNEKKRIDLPDFKAWTTPWL